MQPHQGGAALPVLCDGGAVFSSPPSGWAVLFWLVLLSHPPLVWCGAAFLLLGGATFSSLLLKERSGKVSRGSPFLGGAASRRLSSVRINRRLLVHQLVLLMFDHRALLTHLRLQLLQPLRNFVYCGFNHSSATMRGQVTERDFFLSRFE